MVGGKSCCLGRPGTKHSPFPSTQRPHPAFPWPTPNALHSCAPVTSCSSTAPSEARARASWLRPHGKASSREPLQSPPLKPREQKPQKIIAIICLLTFGFTQGLCLRRDTETVIAINLYYLLLTFIKWPSCGLGHMLRISRSRNKHLGVQRSQPGCREPFYSPSEQEGRGRSPLCSSPGGTSPKAFGAKPG